MILRPSSRPLAAGALCAALALSGPSLAQTISGGTSGGVSGAGVSASTYGSGTMTNTPDRTAVGVEGGGAATAVDGVARTDSKANVRDDRGMQRSTASARTEDERARSTTHTIVNPSGVRSRTSSFYREQGSKPVHETTTTRVAPDGTVTTR
jgi:hypothetical protein